MLTKELVLSVDLMSVEHTVAEPAINHLYMMKPNPDANRKLKSQEKQIERQNGQVQRSKYLVVYLRIE